jgi:hypothetical protein
MVRILVDGYLKLLDKHLLSSIWVRLVTSSLIELRKLLVLKTIDLEKKTISLETEKTIGG